MQWGSAVWAEIDGYEGLAVREPTSKHKMRSAPLIYMRGGPVECSFLRNKTIPPDNFRILRCLLFVIEIIRLKTLNISVDLGRSELNPMTQFDLLGHIES